MLSPILFNSEFRGHTSRRKIYKLPLTSCMTTYNRIQYNSFLDQQKVLQNILCKLESFRDFADLDANLDKTKVLKFLNSYSLTYGANKLENFKSYKYFGQILSQHENVNLASIARSWKKLQSMLCTSCEKRMGDHYRGNITNVN